MKNLAHWHRVKVGIDNLACTSNYIAIWVALQRFHSCLLNVVSACIIACACAGTEVQVNMKQSDDGVTRAARSQAESAHGALGIEHMTHAVVKR